MQSSQTFVRRSFLKTAFSATGTLALSAVPAFAGSAALAEPGENILGPRPGYSPHVGSMVSMLSWMRMVILFPVKDMTVEQLDYIHDDKSNSIGAMLFHLAATERFYQIHTFEEKKWGDWSEKDKTRFDVAMRLGADARTKIKGNNLDFYLSTLEEVRATSLAEFKKRDDAWLMKVDNDWGWGPTNNYCKWFHVCEHESNHNGQIKWIKGRLPGAKGGSE